MLNVVVTGPRGGRVDAKVADVLLDISYVCITELNIGRFNGVVYIRLFNTLDGADGYCAAERVRTSDNRNEWDVSIDLVHHKDDMAGTFSTLCHEFVHAKQFLRKELSECGNYWKGTFMKDRKGDPWGINLPHEKEAYHQEKVLLKRTAKSVGFKWAKKYNMVYDRGII